MRHLGFNYLGWIISHNRCGLMRAKPSGSSPLGYPGEAWKVSPPQAYCVALFDET